MTMTVNSNVASLTVQKNLNKASESLSTTMQRLSSGLKINSAKDDAAGLQIANRLTSQITGLNTAVKNANDGISIAQTAEGALQESTNILQRMREVSLQSANGSNSAEDRASLDQEFQALSKELTRIAETTTFGTGMKLLDGSSGTLSFQIGANANENISFSLGKMDAASLKSASSESTVVGSVFPATTSEVSGTAPAFVGDKAIQAGDFKSIKIDGVDVDLSAVTSKADAAAAINTALGADGSAAYDPSTDRITLTAAAAPGGDGFTLAEGTTGDGSLALLGLTAAAGTTAAGASPVVGTAIGDIGSGAATTKTVNADDIHDIQVNGTKIDLSGATSLDEVASAIDAEKGTTGVSASVDADSGKLVLTSEDGSSFSLANDDVANDGLTQLGLTAGDSELTTGTLAKDTSISINGNEIKFTAGDDMKAVAEKINSAGLGVSATADDSGKLVLNSFGQDIKLADGENSDGTANGGLAALGLAATGTSSVTAKATTTHVAGSGLTKAGIAADSSISINGKSVSLSAGDDIDAVITKINETADIGVTASKDADGQLVLNSDSDITIAAPASGTSALGDLGLTPGTTTATETSVDDLNITSAYDAQKSIQVIDAALKQIDSQRAELGAVQNRFDSTISNLQSISENATSARSRVQDADFAAETAELTKQQTLQQASTSILSQANQLPSAVLKLLQ